MACLFFFSPYFSLRWVYRSQPFVKVFKCNSKATCWYCDSYCGSLEHVDRFREKTTFVHEGFIFSEQL